MPLRLDVKRSFFQRSDRVKGVDVHPTEPWLLANLYSGHVYIWNYNDQTVVKSFEVTELPVRTAKFVARKQWVITGADDMYIRVYNHNTMEKIKSFEAHTDYIRCLAVHPTQAYILSSSDDMLIKLWDWEKGWACTQIFEGHSHYVMQCVFNPKDTNTFASASLDRTVKVWSVGQPTPNFTLEGHEKGVNCVDYFVGGDRPFLLSGADDRLAKVWDYQTKACVQTLEGHAHNVSAVMFHPELPVILTGSEDGTVRIWHSNTYRLESTLNYGLERVWALGYIKGSNSVAMGFDDGAVMIKIGREEPVASMDSSGKIIWARHNEIQTVNVKSLGNDSEEVDGERLPLPAKDLGSCDLYPQTLSHNPNGRFVTVCGDGEYIIYTALAWRNKSFGTAEEFVWGEDSSVYATREGTSTVKIFKNFKEVQTLKPGFSVERIFGGAMLGIAGSDFVCFYDWAAAKPIRRIDVPVREVRWSDSGELVAILSDQSFYVLRFARDVVDAHLESGADIDEDGIDDAFELLNEVSEHVRTGLWVGDCFIYNNSSWRLNYCVGGEVTTMFHLDRPMYLLGYLASQSRIYLIDKEYGIIGYTLLMSLIEYKTLVMREDYDGANSILPTIPQDQMNNVAKFLESRGMPEQALEVATDADYRFELAVQLGRLDTALGIAGEADSESKWKQLGELAMSSGKLDVAEHCLKSAKDLSGLLLLYSARGSAGGLATLTSAALEGGKNNVAFVARFLLGDLDGCVDLLVESGRIPEAAFFARTYLPSRISEVVALWRKDLQKINPKAAESLADPGQYANLFPGMDLALQAEQLQAKQRSATVPAAEFPEHEGRNMEDLIEAVRSMGVNGHAEGHSGGGGDAPDANGTSQHYHVAEDDQTLEEEFLAEEEPAVEEESYPEPTAAVDDVLEQAVPQPPTSEPLASTQPPTGEPEFDDAQPDDVFDEDLGEEDLGLDDTGADIDDDWGMDDEEAEQEA